MFLALLIIDLSVGGGTGAGTFDSDASAAATVLLDDSYNGEIIEVTGPKLITFRDIVNIISRTSGRKLNFYDITLEEYIEGMKQMQIPSDVVWLIEYLFSHVLTNPNNQLVVNDIERVLGRKAKPFSEYAKETAKSGVWNAEMIQTN